MAPVMNHQDSRARAAAAYRLRAVGRTWQEVADALGYRSCGAAHTAVTRHLDRTPAESVSTARRSATESLRIVQSVLFERFADAKQRGDDETLAMLARELRNNVGEVAKLRGLYAPARSEVEINIHQTATAILDRAESELLALTAERQRQIPVLDAEVIAQ
jgi:hypothetical protein